MPFVDDLTITNDDQLLRRISPQWFVPDYNEGRWRPSSASFEDSPDNTPMSVHLVSVLEAAGIPSASVLHGHEGYGLVQFAASMARQLAQLLVRDPQPNEPAHVLVVGNKSRSIRRQFAMSAVWVVEPMGPLPPEGA